MTFYRILFPTAFVLTLAFAVVGPSQAQETPQDLLIRADQLIADGEYSEGWEILETLTRDYAGQVWDAEARMHQAYVLLMVRRDPIGGEAMLTSIASDFPGTEVAIRARRELLDTWAARQPAFDSRSATMTEYLRRLDELIVELGGSPIDNSVYSMTRIDALDEESQRSHLDYLYLSASSQLGSGAIQGQFSNQNPDLDAEKRAFQIDLRRFGFHPEAHDYNDTFELYGSGQRIHRLTVSDYGRNDHVPPLLTALEPRPGSTVRTRRPRIVYSIQSGTVLEQPVNVNGWTFTLDGQPIEGLALYIAANLDDPAAPFLTYERAFQPTTDLSFGVHRVKVTATELGDNENLAEFEWEFTVAADGPTTETRPANQDALVYERSRTP